MGCIGALDHRVMARAVAAAGDALRDMGVASAAPPAAARSARTAIAP
jgi:2-aminoethylphosphonate-pyruvate transaminase